ncbi:MAG: hypothetical protein ACI8S6_002859 [Myxococcota bacterium]|jgi:hypothetical protein
MADKNEQTTKPPSTWRIKLKFLVIGLLFGGIAGGVGAGKIYLDARAEVTSMQEQMSSLESRQGIFEAQIAIAAASVELRRENFGDAKSSVNTARARLDTVDAAAANIDAGVLKTIQGRLDGINIATAGETGLALTALDDISLAIDRLINPI